MSLFETYCVKRKICKIDFFFTGKIDFFSVCKIDFFSVCEIDSFICEIDFFSVCKIDFFSVCKIDFFSVCETLKNSIRFILFKILCQKIKLDKSYRKIFDTSVASCYEVNRNVENSVSVVKHSSKNKKI
ncbi:hypothetical protein KUTeg_023336 [Tegillarca granosa]|uniref:Uncharacterized protein n=1 Tax=Tegillarca granosa TaxID=220873 RepID=A0ABQ9E6A6_TEGGR|nr:hypothetical protein KUTeg_023336 [Tegillarca granosa]